MHTVRTAAAKDRQGIKELWKLCFSDSDGFVDWFFKERYFPEYSACLLEEEDRIMSAMQGLPMHVSLRGVLVPALMLTGVSTHPERGGRGYMRDTILHFMKIARDNAFPVVIHTPAHMPTFFSRGHYPATNTLRFEQKQANYPRLPEHVRPQDMLQGLSSLHQVYRLATLRYSGCAVRSLIDFYFKFRDYHADRAQCLVYETEEGLRGYCAYYGTDEFLHAEECIALDETAYHALLLALQNKAAGRKLTVKLPPDVRLGPELRAFSRIQYQGAMGVANVSSLLRMVLADPSFVLQVEDASVFDNTGTWNGLGEKSTQAPQATLSAGHLAQLLGGYCSLEELHGQGHVAVHDEKAMNALAKKLPKEVCFIIDEY